MSEIDLVDLEIANVESDEEEKTITPLKYDLFIYPADYPLLSLYQRWQNGEIIIPTFQRGFVWTKIQASRLIESFMMGLPIPQVFFYVQSDNKHLVIDGQQRLMSIFYFFEGYFGNADASGRRREFRLEGINEKSKWYGKKYDEFDDEDKRNLNNSILRVIMVKQLQPDKDHTSVYHIFERLNTGGTPLKDQEVRNCVYSGKLNDLLLELNTYQNWRDVIGKSKLDPRQKDVQLILRYFALLHNGSNYKKPMRDFLSEFMDENKNPSDVFIHEERIRFQKTCDVLVNCLGKRPFNPKGAISATIFDSIFTAFAKNLNNIPTDIVKRYNNLVHNSEFEVYTDRATTDTDTVQNRLKLAEKILFG